MAKYIMLIGILHGGGDPVVISGPEVPYADQRKKFKETAAERVHSKFERVDFLDSVRGVRKHAKFITPDEAKRRDKELRSQAKQALPVSDEAPPKPPA